MNVGPAAEFILPDSLIGENRAPHDVRYIGSNFVLGPAHHPLLYLFRGLIYRSTLLAVEPGRVRQTPHLSAESTAPFWVLKQCAQRSFTVRDEPKSTGIGLIVSRVGEREEPRLEIPGEVITRGTQQGSRYVR